MNLRLDLFAGEARRRVHGTLSQRAGLYYERRVAKWFIKRFPHVVPQVRVTDSDGVRYPDLLVFDKDLFSCIVVEVKHQYSDKAWWQVSDYRDLLAKCLPWVRVSSLVVCAQVLERPRFEGVGRPRLRLVTLDQLGNLSAFWENVLVLSEHELRREVGGPELGGGVAPTVVGQSRGIRNGVRGRDGVSRMAAALEG